MDQCVPDVCDPLVLTPESSPLRKKASPKLIERRLNDSPSLSPTSRLLGVRASPSVSDDDTDDQEAVCLSVKRRKMNYDSPCFTPSSCGTTPPLTSDTSLDESLLTASMLLPSGWGDLTPDTSARSSPTMSPSPSSHIFQPNAAVHAAAHKLNGHSGKFRGRYKKDELWPAIEGNYQFLMDEEIIETCKSTESDLSWESDDVAANVTTVSFIEFFQQYKELTDWLTHIQAVTQRQSASLSEKYLNQTYHEEMLQRSPRRKLFNDYAKQLMRRYPSRKDEVTSRLSHLNKLWAELEAAITPLQRPGDTQTMLNDLDDDLAGLCKWLHEIEAQLRPLSIGQDWTMDKLQQKLQEHQVLQRDLESHSKIVSAVLKLCDRLRVTGSEPPEGSTAASGATIGSDKKLLAASLERRWHAILLQALEWQCTLEEAINNGIKKRPTYDCTTPDSDDSLTGDNFYPSENSSYRGGRGTNKSDDGLESDFDVIPFSESEYEKITADIDVQTDDVSTGAVTIPAATSSHQRASCEQHVCGTDSALGRSVSDHSLGSDPYRLSQDHITQAVRAATQHRDMRAAHDMAAQTPGGDMKTRGTEHQDVGYSSESHHSNEEQDYQRRYATEINGNHGNHDNTGLDHEGNKAELAKLRPPKATKTPESWRHSMTSAYDTSSTHSDHNSNSPDDQERASPERRYFDRTNVSTLLSCPSHNFYKMTTIETDSEATSTADRHVAMDDRSGAATDAESELSRSLELPYDDTPIRYDSDNASLAARMRLEAVFEKVEPLDTPMGSLGAAGAAQCVPEGGSRGALSDGDLSMDEVDRDGETNALFEMEDGASNKHRRTNQHNLKHNNNIAHSNSSVNRLLQQAKLLTDDTALWPNNRPWYSTTKLSNGAHEMRLNQSFTSTDGSVLHTDDSVPCSAQSACEASCESDGGEMSSMSSGSDVDESSYDQNQTRSADNTLCASPQHSRLQHSTSLGQSLLRRRLSHRHKSRSSDDLDSAQYSISESAINDLRPRNNTDPALHRLRRTTSDLPGLVQRQSTPRKAQRRRRIRRAGSEETAKLSPAKLLHSQSLPGSRRHSSRSHSRSLSPLHKAAGSDSESQATPLQVTGVPIPPRGRTDDTDTDAQHQSLTSAAEFSENAWDNLHHIYSAISSDPGEEKLDASLFHRDWDFPAMAAGGVPGSGHTSPLPGHTSTLPGHTSPRPSDSLGDGHGSAITGTVTAGVVPVTGHRERANVVTVTDKSKPKSKDKRQSSSKLSASASHAEDSDSDLEEVLSVIDEARRALKFTENTVKKHRKDNMETGIFIDPSEYDAPLATCEEHIVCLEELKSVLEVKSGLDSEEIQEITDMIARWRGLGALAAQRQAQSAAVAEIYRDLVTLRGAVTDATRDADRDSYDNVEDLETAVKALQENKMTLQHDLRSSVAALVDRLTNVEERYPDLKLARFDEEINILQQNLDTAMSTLSSRSADLQSGLSSWYDFSETHRELQFLLAQEKRHLGCLDGTEDALLALLSDTDLRDTRRDLQVRKNLDTELAHYEAKLQAMKTAHAEVAKLYSQTAHREMRGHFDDIEKTFSVLRRNCKRVASKIDEKLTTDGKQDKATTTMDDARLSTVAAADTLTPDPGVSASAVSTLCWRLLRLALPVSLALVLGFSLLCLYDPDFCPTGIVFSPRLRYVNGPPPT